MTSSKLGTEFSSEIKSLVTKVTINKNYGSVVNSLPVDSIFFKLEGLQQFESQIVIFDQDTILDHLA